ncbi:PREDICTED: caffeoylshikimate esterase [Tarenaya hassleriana]|uniref:caffeoylshikimate esterase n=1 Tax=Tarenaya hassleriana TaxID=28532 RepID=UPI00053C14D5|nr:PREDICTED: caffeoylshikimate esterase [Tarenaya hassleriana]
MARIEGQVGYSEDFIVNSRGMKLFTCKWFPVNQEPRAMIFYCHGYAVECGNILNDIATKFGNDGFAVYGIEYEGHGRSDGLSAYINDFDVLIDDVYSHFSKISEMGENPKKKKFLMGESMGGAVALLLHRKNPEFWDGAILLAPMCKIAEDVKPPKIVISMMQMITKVIPTWKSVISNDIIEVAFKQPEARKSIQENPRCYKGRPRYKTMSELYRVSIDLEHRLNEVTMSFIVLHGEEDKVTDKEASKELYNVASSKDKTLKLYPGMWHSLLFGEPPENSQIVFNDIIQWLEERTTESRVSSDTDDHAGNVDHGPRSQL